MKKALTQPTIDIPRHVWDAVNNAIHTCEIDGCVQPISLCYVAVRAAIAAWEAGEPQPEDPKVAWLKEQLAKPDNGLSQEVA
jgi:hypothetical protein